MTPRPKGNPKGKSHPAEFAFDKKELDKRNAHGLGTHSLVPLKELAKAEEEMPFESAPHFENRAVEERGGPRFSALSTAREALVSGPSDEETDPLTIITKRLTDKEYLPFTTHMTDDELKAISLLTAGNKKARCELLNRAIEKFIIYRVSMDRKGRSGIEELGKALGRIKEELSNNGVKALFERVTRK